MCTGLSCENYTPSLSLYVSQRQIVISTTIGIILDIYSNMKFFKIYKKMLFVSQKMFAMTFCAFRNFSFFGGRFAHSMSFRRIAFRQGIKLRTMVLSPVAIELQYASCKNGVSSHTEKQRGRVTTSLKNNSSFLLPMMVPG